MPTAWLRRGALGSYVLLLIWVLAWHVWWSPHPQLSQAFMLSLWVLPLLLPLPGLLAGRRYTHAWSNFILLLYVAHSLTLLLISPAERLLALGELLLSLLSFAMNLLLVRRTRPSQHS